MKKKMFLFLICVICLLGVTACGNKTKLTKENYDKYLNIEVETRCKGSYSSECSIVLSTWSKSTNFNYNDIKVKVKAEYQPYVKYSFGYSKTELKSIEITSESVDIAGKSEIVIKLPLSDYLVMEGSSDEKFEILEISGNVTPA